MFTLAFFVKQKSRLVSNKFFSVAINRNCKQCQKKFLFFKTHTERVFVNFLAFMLPHLFLLLLPVNVGWAGLLLGLTRIDHKIYTCNFIKMHNE